MKLYIKERLIALGSKFDVYDEDGGNIFIAEADKFDIGKNISIYNSSDRKVLYMRQQIRFGAHKYLVYDKEMKEIATIKKEFMTPEYNITGSVGNMTISGLNILGRSYDIIKDGIIIGKINKEFTLGRDRYILDVIDERYTEFFVGVSIMIDMVRFHSDN